MEAKWALRPAQAEDHDFLFKLNETTMREHAERVWGWDHEEQVAFFANRFQPERWQVIQVERQDIGVLIVNEDDDQIYLAEIQILPEWQGRGIGSSIIGSLMKSASGAGKPLTLRVLRVNERARALYERLGFQPFKEIETYTYFKWSASRAWEA